MSWQWLDGALELLKRNAAPRYTPLLRKCAEARSLRHGKAAHAYILCNGQWSLYLAKLLVHMYGHCGDLEAAKSVFHGSPERDSVLWNTLIGAYHRNGRNREALELFFEMDCPADTITFTTVLRVCSALGALAEGAEVHQQAASRGFQADTRVQNSLINMYAKCGDLQAAKDIFDRSRDRDVGSWNSIIVGHAQAGDLQYAQVLYRRMQQEGVMPSGITVSSILTACTSREQVQSIHITACNERFDQDCFVQNTLMTAYARCGYLKLGRQVFDRMHTRDLVSWNSMISAYCQRGRAEEAVQLYEEMNVQPDEITFASVLGACSQIGAAQLGKRVHERIKATSFESSETVTTSLIHMYCKLGLLADAKAAFDMLSGDKKQYVSPWNALIGGYTQQCQPKEALNLFKLMESEAVKPDKITFVNVLVACTAVRDWEVGLKIADRIRECGALSDEVVASSLITMYSRCGRMDTADKLFRTMQTTNGVVWNAMFAAYVQSGDLLQAEKALLLATRMDLEGVTPDEITFIQVLAACSIRGDLQKGKSVHARALASGFEGDVILETAIVSMYARCKALKVARDEFEKMAVRTVITWNAMISSYAQAGHTLESMLLYEQMNLEGVTPDVCTFAILLSVCSGLHNLRKGRAIHGWMVECGYSGGFLDAGVVTMYAKCDQLETARSVFESLENKNINSWNAIITAYTQVGQGKEALELFDRMELAGVFADEYAFATAFTACLTFGGWKKGQELYQRLQSRDLKYNVVLETAILNMHAKCGSADALSDFFSIMKAKDTVSWNTMVASQKEAEAAIEVSQQAALEGVVLEETIFLSLLLACSHSGLVDKSHEQFVSMTLDWGITPTADHYRCITDVLGRAGKLEDGKELVLTMPFHPDTVFWRALLGSCRVQGQVEHAAQAAEAACNLDDREGTTYLLLSNSFTGN